MKDSVFALLCFVLISKSKLVFVYSKTIITSRCIEDARFSSPCKAERVEWTLPAKKLFET